MLNIGNAQPFVKGPASGEMTGIPTAPVIDIRVNSKNSTGLLFGECAIDSAPNDAA